MRTLLAPVVVLDAARNFFTPPAVTPVSGPASWFAAQRPGGADTAPDGLRPRAVRGDALVVGIDAYEGDEAADAGPASAGGRAPSALAA